MGSAKAAAESARAELEDAMKGVKGWARAHIEQRRGDVLRVVANSPLSPSAFVSKDMKTTATPTKCIYDKVKGREEVSREGTKTFSQIIEWLPPP